MRKEIEAQRDLDTTLEAVEDEVRAIAAATERAGGTVHAVGCGDSGFAALAVAPFFESVGVPFRAHTSYEFSRYVAPHLGSEDVVVPVSMSGNSARTVEGAARAADRGAHVAGISDSPDGRLAREFEGTVLLGLDTEPGWTPGTLSYLASAAVLYRLGIDLADGGPPRDRLFDVLGRLGEAVDGTEGTARAVAANLSQTDPAPPVYVLGGGPSRATAKYGAAKLLEVCDALAVGRESEEFAHGEFWMLDKNNPVFVVAPEGNGFSRTREVAEGVREFGNDLVVVTDVPELAALGKYSFDLEFGDDLFSPLVAPVPLQYVAYHYAMERGLDPNRRTNVDPFRKQVSRTLTRGSDVET
jgi:glucosamine--fructose-6-phosphate aminotransferase (isomerizing)